MPAGAAIITTAEKAHTKTQVDIEKGQAGNEEKAEYSAHPER
jgi:hypothetical protein